jgi:hypothetical protein
MEITIIVALISAILGPIIVTYYKEILIHKLKSKNPVVDSLKFNNLIDNQLDNIQKEFDASRVWIFQFHNGGNFYPTGTSIQKFSIFYEKCFSNVKSTRDIFSNIPVSLFAKPFMHLYENNEILISNYKHDPHHGLEIFADVLDTKSSYLFSLNSINDEFLGVLGIEYCDKAKKLNESQLSELRIKSISIGTLLSSYLYKDKSIKK